MSEYRAIVYLPIKPEIAKKLNLPLKLPIRVEDLPIVADRDRIPLDVIIRGLEAQCDVKDESREYYLTYLVFFYYEKVKELVSRGDYEEALDLVERAGKLLKDYRYHFYRGIVMKGLGRTGEAEVELKLSHSENPKFALAHYELGRLQMEEGELDEARKSFERAFEIDEAFPLPLVKIGDIELSLGNLERAMEMYEKALELDPNLPDVYNRLGVMNNELQKFEVAKKMFEKALEISPDYPDALYNLSYTYVRLGKPFKALRILMDLEKRFLEDPKILNELGVLFREVGLFEDSAERLRKAYEISGESWVGFNYVRTLSMVDRDEALRVADDLKDPEMRENALKLLDLSTTPVRMEGTLYTDEVCLENLECVLKTVESEELSERLEEVLENGIPMEDTDLDTMELLDVAVACFLRSRDFAEMERRSVEIGVALYGSGVMLGVIRVLLRLFQFKMVEGYVDVHRLLDDVVPEIQDLDWKLALRISRATERPPIFGSRKGSDLVVALLSNLHGESEEADDLVRFFTDMLKQG